jgi:hypothetical protein
MTIVASGSSLGAVVHPLMLNNTFRRVGFATAVRASAGLVGGLLLIACLLMRPRLPPATSHPSFWKSLPRFARDTPYVLAVIACVPRPLSIGCEIYGEIFYVMQDVHLHGRVLLPAILHPTRRGHARDQPEVVVLLCASPPIPSLGLINLARNNTK